MGWSKSCPNRCTAGNEPLGDYVDLRAGLDVSWKRKTSCLCRNTNPGPPACNLVTIPNTLPRLLQSWYIQEAAHAFLLSRLVCRLINSNLKTERTVSSETSVRLYQTTRRHVPGHSNPPVWHRAERQARRRITDAATLARWNKRRHYANCCSRHAVKGINGAYAGDWVLIPPQPPAAWACSTFRSAGNEQSCHGNRRLRHVPPTQTTNLTVAQVRFGLFCQLRTRQRGRGERRR